MKTRLLFTTGIIFILSGALCAQTTGLLYDGVNSYAAAPHNNAYDIGFGNFTMEAWINADVAQTASNYPVIMSNRGTTSFSGFMFFLGTNYTITLQTDGINHGLDTYALNDGQCHHVAVVRSSTSLLSWYIDGQLRYTSPDANYDITTSNGLMFGNDSADALNDPWKGTIQEVRFWNVARTQSQLQATMNNQLTGTEPGLIGYWRMDDGSGQTIKDYSPTNNAGFLGSTTSPDVNDPLFTPACLIIPISSSSCSCSTLGAELVGNGDFSAGNTGFTSPDYIFSATDLGAGRYGIDTNAQKPNGNWKPCHDHTTGNGNFMWIDGSSVTPGSTFWSETVSVTPNTNYVFSYWFDNLDLANLTPGPVQVFINNLPQGIEVTPPHNDSSCIWLQNCISWNSGNNTSATISIRTTQAFFLGYDFGVDDISFRPCVTTQPLCSCPSVGSELAVNGDFNAGNTGFTSPDYIFSTIDLGAGRYGIDTNSFNANGNWQHCQDHTTGNGNFMWVDADRNTPGTTFWQETIPVTPNTNYVFSYWFDNLNGLNYPPGPIQLFINNLPQGSEVTPPPNTSTCIWVQNCISWNSGSNTSAAISLRATQAFFLGYDFGIDDISFRQCLSSIPVANFSPTDTTICAEGGGCINFHDHSLGNPTSWKWLFPGATPDSSVQQNPTNICYNNPGTYSVTLIITNSSGTDTLTISPTVTVGGTPPAPVITVQGGDTLICSHASSYQWFFNGSPIPAATDSFYVATNSGSYNVLITDSIGCSRFGTNVQINSVNELNGSAGIKIYPNPVKDQFIVYTSEFVVNATLEIYNILGENVYIDSFNGNSKTISCKLSAGVYFVRVRGNERQYVQKIVVQ